MKVFDFDKTLYKGDSTLDFYKFCLKRHPSIALVLPSQLFAALRYATHIIEKTRFKECFYRFLTRLHNPEQDVEDFWHAHSDNMNTAIWEQASQGDVVISASPEFLIEKPCKERGLAVIASQVDLNSGKTNGLNCWGEEKVRRFREKYPETMIDAFYSDSESDLPMALQAKMSYLVSGSKMYPWKVR